MTLRFHRTDDRRLIVTVGGITYTATFYPAGSGQRSYWTIRVSPTDYDYDTEGENWYCSSEAEVRASIATLVHLTTLPLL